MHAGWLSSMRRAASTGSQAVPDQRVICTSKGGEPPKVAHIGAAVPATTLVFAGCVTTDGATNAITVSTAGALTSIPAPLDTMTLYTAPLSAT